MGRRPFLQFHRFSVASISVAQIFRAMRGVPHVRQGPRASPPPTDLLLEPIRATIARVSSTKPPDLRASVAALQTS